MRLLTNCAAGSLVRTMGREEELYFRVQSHGFRERPPPRLLARLNKVDGYLYRILSNTISRRISSFENAAPSHTQHMADTPYRDMWYTRYLKCDVWHLSNICITFSLFLSFSISIKYFASFVIKY